MPVKRIVGIVLVVVGAIVAWQGWEEKQSFGGQLGSAMGSMPTGALVMMGVGGVLVVVGGAFALRR